MLDEMPTLTIHYSKDIVTDIQGIFPELKTLFDPGIVNGLVYCSKINELKQNKCIINTS